MPERSTIAQVVQIGVETTPGTGVAANKQFLSTSISPAVKVAMQDFRAVGQKFPSVIVPGKEWVEAKVAGAGSYNELTYLLSSVLVDPGAPATVDTSAKRYTYTPSVTTEDTPKTFTVEQGSSVRAGKFAYGIINELEVIFNRDGVDIAGTMLGQRYSDGITMTASPTAIANMPILPTDIDVYLDATSGGIGGTKLTRVLKATWKLSNRWGTFWPLNSANTSFQGHVEIEPKLEIKLMIEADSNGMANLTAMRGGTTQFLRLSATSPTLAGVATAKFQVLLDTAVKVMDVSEFQDDGGIYALDFTFKAVYDTGWAKALTAQVTNQLASL